MIDQVPPITFRDFDQISFSGGINTSVKATDIKDDEVVNLLNMELDDGDNLVTRQGVSDVSIGSLWDQALWDVSLWGSTSYSSRITSIKDFFTEGGLIGVLYTTGNQLYSVTRDLETVTNLTGALVLPNDTFWQWEIMNSIAIGVNKATTGNNPVKVVGPAPGTASALGGNPPRAKYIAQWNSRLWLVRSDEPNQIQASNIGDPEGWDTDAGSNPAHGAIFDSFGGDDGDLITGMFATKARLFVFKREKIYVMFPTAAPATDLNNLKIEIYAPKIGAMSPYSIRGIGNEAGDAVFLSQFGVPSLNAAEVVGDFTTSLLSRKVKDIASIGKNFEEIGGFVLNDVNQYWLCVPSNVSPEGKNITYVMDYRRILEGLVRWTKFDGYAWATCMDSYADAKTNYLLGCHDPVLNKYFIGRYVPRNDPRQYRDGSNAIDKKFKSKSYNLGKAKIRKLFNTWMIEITVLTTTCAISVNYFFNVSETSSGSYGYNFSIPASGSLYDISLYDTALYDVGVSVVEKIIQEGFLFNDNGRKAISVDFEITNANLDQGYNINGLSINYADLTSARIRNI